MRFATETSLTSPERASLSQEGQQSNVKWRWTMRQSNVVFMVASAAIASLSGLVPVGVRAQASQAGTQSPPHAVVKPYDWKASFAKYPVGNVPRTRDGKPDLEGIWSHSVLTPLERPAAAQNKTEFSLAEAKEAEEFARQAAVDLRVEPTATPPGEKTTDAYNSFWRDGYWYKVPMTTLRTSQVVDPPDGRVPPLTRAAIQRQQDTLKRVNGPPTGPEDRPLSSRCVRPVRVGPPFTGTGPGSQESTFQIVQSRDVVVVRPEAHESQMIYLDQRARPPENIRLYKGAARGSWEEDTLVVDSTNFNTWAMGGTFNYGNTEKAHLIERWKRLDENHLLYGFTIEDPGTWMRPWSLEVVMWRLPDQEQLVEYACHEGNVGLEFTLSGARAQEREQQAEENGDRLAVVTGASREAVSNSAPRPSPEPSAVAYRTNDLGMEFAMVPAGEFQMGCSEGAKPNECSKDERPRHSVQITKAFEIAKTEVTGKQWQAVMESDPSAFRGEDLPVEQVTFGQVQEFLNKLNARNDGFLYRLPTEAEWEYAARAGTTDEYAGSLRDMAWYNDSRGAAVSTGGRRDEDSPTGLAAAKTHAVATKKPNMWGIFDMRGNVAEWVQDFYDPNYYSVSPAADPKGPPSGEGHVVRGGSFHVYPWLTRVSLRTMFPETYKFDDVGFRVVREKR
jgi:formylglycine-generating enzyme required for sulfatase activity